MPNCIKLSTFAFARAAPPRFVFSEHPIAFRGMRADPRYVWGAYGHNGRSGALRLTGEHADRVGMHFTELRLFFQLREYENVGAINREIVERTGFLNLLRLQRDYREEVRMVVLGHLESTLDAVRLSALKSMSLEQLVMAHPAAAQALLTLLRGVDVVVHPVIPVGDDGEGPAFNIATVLGKAARKMQVRARYHEQIPASC